MYHKLLVMVMIGFSFLFSAEVETREEIGIYEKQGAIIPLDLTFINEYDQSIQLQDLLNEKPTILSFNYFDCPTICYPQLHAIASVVNRLDLKPYIDYNIITISIEPNDTPAIALKKKKSIINTIHKDFPPQTWSYLTGKQENIDRITDTVGFKYQKRIKEGVVDYLHPGVLIVLSPEGKITRYMNGLDYSQFDLKLALIEASQGKIGPTIAKAIAYCFAYDAENKKYVFAIEKIFATLLTLIMLGFLIYLILTQRSKSHKKDEINE